MDLLRFWIFSFLCVAVKSEGTVVSQDRVRFIREPKDQIVVLGSTVEFPCTARCLDNSEGRCQYVTWAKNGVPVLDNASIMRSQNGSLIIKNVQLSAEGYYQCVIVLPTHGVFVGRRATLKVARTGLLTEEPEDVDDAIVGGAVRFPCSATSSFPLLNVTWFHNEDPIFKNETENRRVIVNGALQIRNLRQSDNGTYYCQLTNIAGTISSRRAVLNVSQAVNTSHLALKMIYAPRNLTVRQGETAIFECVVQFYDRIFWKRIDETPLSSKAYISGDNLIIPDVSSSDQGTYECIVKSSGTLLKSSADLTVHWPPSITRPPEETIRSRGESWRLNCHTSANPEPEITWFKNGERLRSRGRIKIFPNEDSLPATLKTPSGDTEFVRDLLITSIEKEDHAVYQCFVENYLGSSGGAAALIYHETEELDGPSNLTAVLLPHEDAIELFWQPPPLDLSNRSIIFIIHFHESDSGSENTMAAKYESCREGVCRVVCCSNINLSPYTVYTFWVDALLDFQPPGSVPRFTKPSQQIYVRTGDAVASSAAPLLVRETREPDVIKLSWKRQDAESIKGEIMEYRIELKTRRNPESGDLIWWRQPIVIPGFMKEFTVHDVDDHPLYIRVIPRTRAGYPSSYPISAFPYLRYNRLQNTTIPNGNFAAPVADARALNSSSIFVQWSLDQNILNHDSFVWNISATSLTDEQTVRTFIQYDQNWTVLSSLTPETLYQIMVHLSSPNGSEGLKSILLAKTASSGSAILVSRDVQSIVPYPTPFCEPAGPGQLKIHWQKPPANIVRIFIRYSLLPQDSNEPLNVSASTQTRETTADSLIFSDLIPGRMYLFAVSAQNGAGYKSVYSHDVNCSVPFLKPPPPSQVQAAIINESLFVWWTPILSSDQFGDVLFYHIRYASHSAQSAWNEVSVSGTSTSAEIPHLECPSSEYTVAVSAEGVSGRGLEFSLRTTLSHSFVDNAAHMSSDNGSVVTVFRTSYLEGVIVGVSVGIVIALISAIIFIMRSRHDRQSCVYRLFYMNRQTGLKFANGDCHKNGHENGSVRCVEFKEMQTLLPILIENAESDAKGSDVGLSVQQFTPRPLVSLTPPMETDEMESVSVSCQNHRSAPSSLLRETRVGITSVNSDLPSNQNGTVQNRNSMDHGRNSRYYFASMPDLLEGDKKLKLMGNGTVHMPNEALMGKGMANKSKNGYWMNCSPKIHNLDKAIMASGLDS